MAARSTTEQSSFLLSRRVAEARSRGAMSPDSEALALFESISLNLLLRPRAVLYFAMLAKNGLRKAVVDELSSVASMRSAILDLGNAVLSVRSTTQLESARLALLQMEQLDRISTTGNQYKKFDSSVTEFLTKTIGKSVRRIGSTSLTRPGSEAASDMVTEFTSLQDLHTDFLDRLYALLVGVENFINSPLATIIGLTTAARARSDIESLIDDIEAEGALDASRDMAIRLITDRAALKTIGNLPAVADHVIDTSQALPAGYVISGASDLTSASVTSSDGPFTLPVLAQASVTVNGTTLGPFNIPQTSTDLQNKAAVVSTAVTYPITMPANYYLFLSVDGVPRRLGPYAAGSTSLASLLSQTATFISASVPLTGLLHVVEFIQAGTSRLLVYHDTAAQIVIDRVSNGEDTDLIGGVEATTFVDAVYTNSINSLVGFTGTEAGVAGQTPVQFVVDAFDVLFGSQTDVVRQGDAFTLTTVATSPGTSMTVTAPTVLGLAGTYYAVSDSIRLYGSVFGVATDPISPIGLVDVGDSLSSSLGSSTIASFNADRITLTSPIRTFDGSIIVLSALTTAYESLIKLMNEFYDSWVTNDLATGLDKMELAVSSLGKNSPQAQRSTVLAALNELETNLLNIKAKLEDPSAVLPSTAAQKELAIANGIIATLEERKFDKALDLFLKCRVQEALDSTADTASFGGSLLKAASDFARTDLVVQNRAIGEGEESTAVSQDVKGL